MQGIEYLVLNNMTETIVNAVSGANGYLTVFLLSLMPIVELRGAVPVGVGLDLNPILVYLVSVLGSSLPVPFIICFIRPIIEYLMTTKYLKGFAEKIKNRTLSKSDKITKYKMFGLLIFVAIPLPGTGAWTGAMLAGLMDMRLKDAVPMIILGVAIAGILMLGISYGFGAIINSIF